MILSEKPFVHKDSDLTRSGELSYVQDFEFQKTLVSCELWAFLKVLVQKCSQIERNDLELLKIMSVVRVQRNYAFLKDDIRRITPVLFRIFIK